MELRPNRVKRKLANNENVVVVSGPTHPDDIDAFGLSGVDGIWLEGEHGGVDAGELGNLTRACDIWGMTSVARIVSNDQGLIYRTLDRGAQGVVVPHVNTREEAENVVAGGAGSGVIELLAAEGVQVPVLNLGIPDIFVEHGKPAELLRDCGLDADGITIQHFEELDVGAVGKPRFVFQHLSPLARLLRSRRVLHHAMRIAYRRSTEFQGSSSDFDCFPDHFTIVSLYWNGRTAETYLTHVHFHLSPLLQNFGLNLPSQGSDGKRFLLNPFRIPKAPDENTQTIAAFFCFAAVRVKNSETKFHFRNLFSNQDSVRPQTKVTVTDADDGILIGFDRPVWSMLSKELIF